MALNVTQELAALERQTVDELRARYAEVFGEQTRSRHRVWLIKRVIWRLQSLEEGDLSERARRRALELANDADLRVSAPRGPRQRMTNHKPSRQTPTAAAHARACAITRQVPGPHRRGPRDCQTASSTKARSTGPSAPWPRRSPGPTGTATTSSD